MFQHTAARRRLARGQELLAKIGEFQHTAARRRLAIIWVFIAFYAGFNTQPPEGGWREKLQKWVICIVSTHSRPKAAGLAYFVSAMMVFSFNTQPPEGGW